MSTLQTLIDARALIADEKNWLQGNANNGEGAYCSSGALWEVEKEKVGFGGYSGALVAYERAEAALARVMRPSVPGYNDAHSHDCVLTAFDEAIEKEKEKETERVNEGDVSSCA